MDVQQLYREAESGLRLAERARLEADQRILALTKIMDGLRLLDPSLGQETAPAPGRQFKATITDSAGVSDSATASVTRTGPELRDLILALLGAERRFLSSQEIIDRLVQAGDLADDGDTAESTRKLISRMVKDGRLARQPRDGRSYNYGIPTPKNAEDPASTGSSVLSISDPLGGGEANGTGDHRDHDRREEGSDHHGGGAPAVMAG